MTQSNYASLLIGIFWYVDVDIYIENVTNALVISCCSAQLRDREHQIRRMETEQEALTKKLSVCRVTRSLYIYLSFVRN